MYLLMVEIQLLSKGRYRSYIPNFTYRFTDQLWSMKFCTGHRELNNLENVERRVRSTSPPQLLPTIVSQNVNCNALRLLLLLRLPKSLPRIVLQPAAATKSSTAEPNTRRDPLNATSPPFNTRQLRFSHSSSQELPQTKHFAFPTVL
jgi:hypothetical protein